MSSCRHQWQFVSFKGTNWRLKVQYEVKCKKCGETKITDQKPQTSIGQPYKE